MKKFLLSRYKSFGHALSGWWHVIRTQQNAWVHAMMTVAVFVVGLWLRVSRIEWVMLIVVIAGVWAAEFFNTALEAVVDLATHEQHPLAKVGKDVGAAAVLIAATAAFGVGVLILGPPLWVKLSSINF
jgi:diacylglycerol kinase